MANIVREKSFAFAVRLIRAVRGLRPQRLGILATQLVRSGTAIGALIREAEYAESRADFVHKLSIALKEANETIYWLELCRESQTLEPVMFRKLHGEAVELLKLLIAITRTAKSRPRR